MFSICVGDVIEVVSFFSEIWMPNRVSTGLAIEITTPIHSIELAIDGVNLHLAHLGYKVTSFSNGYCL